MAATFPNDQLVACARREVKMRETSYPRWEQKASIAECSEKRQMEHAMMQAITEQLVALPELLARYKAAKSIANLGDEHLQLSDADAAEIQRFTNNADEGRIPTHDVVRQYSIDVPALLEDRAALLNEIWRLRSLVPQQ